MKAARKEKVNDFFFFFFFFFNTETDFFPSLIKVAKLDTLQLLYNTIAGIQIKRFLNIWHVLKQMCIDYIENDTIT